MKILGTSNGLVICQNKTTFLIRIRRHLGNLQIDLGGEDHTPCRLSPFSMLLEWKPVEKTSSAKAS